MNDLKLSFRARIAFEFLRAALFGFGLGVGLIAASSVVLAFLPITS